MSLIDIFGVGKEDDTPEWDDSPFSLDYLSQGHNNYEPLGKHMDYEDYRDKETRPRIQTKALNLFTDLGGRDGPLTNMGDVKHLACKYGTDDAQSSSRKDTLPSHNNGESVFFERFVPINMHNG